jgi:NodT family efflux transporter outer membrane factor (OMF) lipoprotein
MTSIRLALAAMIASASAGCAVGPDYHRPAVPLASHYQQAPAQIPAAAAAAPVELATWWNGFGDPMLARYVALALEKNFDLAQARARVAQARAGLGAANAALLPHGELAGSAARARQSTETALGRVLASTPAHERWGNAYEVNASASWEPDLFGGLRRGQEGASAAYQASAALAVATRLAVAAQTADTYLSIRGLQARLDIARRQVATREQLLAKVRLLHAKGIAATYQVQQTEGELAQAQAGVPQLQVALDGALNALDVMLGTPPGSQRGEMQAAMQATMQANSPLPRAPQMGDMGTPAELLQRRPDLIAAERNLAAANARVGQAMAEYYPHFSLAALLGSATTLSSGNLFTGAASQQSAVLGLRWRLFDFGRIDAEIAQAKGREAELLAAYRLAVLHAAEDVENAVSALSNREQQAAILIRGETALGAARAASWAGYQRGAGSLIDVLHADQTLLATADARAQAQTDAARAAVALYKALGGGWHGGPPAGIKTAQAAR